MSNTAAQLEAFEQAHLLEPNQSVLRSWTEEVTDFMLNELAQNCSTPPVMTSSRPETTESEATTDFPASLPRHCGSTPDDSGDSGREEKEEKPAATARCPAWRYSGPDHAARELDRSGLGEEPGGPEPLSDALGLIKRNVLDEGTNHCSSRFFGWVPGGGVYPSALADYIAATSCRFAGWFLANPGAVRMENLLVKWFCEHVAGYPPQEANGFLASGSSLATVSAFVCARDKHRVLTDPLVLPQQRTVYYSQEAHICVNKALWMCGACSVKHRLIPVDSELRIRPEALGAMLEEDLKAGLRPWLLVASAGTVNAGVVDPLTELGLIAQQYQLWFHVDGAYGGLLAMCPEGKDRLRGIELSDSLAADPHKALFLPQGTGLLTVKDGQQLIDSHNPPAPPVADEDANDEDENGKKRGSNAHYLQPFAEAPTDVIQSGAMSPELTKHFRALRLWLPLKVFGLRVFRQTQTEKILLTRYFADQLLSVTNAKLRHQHQQREQREGEHCPVRPLTFELGPYPELSIATYRLRGETSPTGTRGTGSSEREGQGDADTAADLEDDKLNYQLLQRILNDGSVFVTPTRMKDRVWLRLCVLHFKVHKSDVDHYLALLADCACGLQCQV